jgi:hypothetical protein
MLDGRMHQTTVRFGTDLWEALEVECSRLGISAAQFVREAALARLSYVSGQRGDTDYDDALRYAGVNVPADAGAERRDAHDEASEQQLAAHAVGAQSALVLRRAQEVRNDSVRLRRERREMAWRAQ